MVPGGLLQDAIQLRRLKAEGVTLRSFHRGLQQGLDPPALERGDEGDRGVRYLRQPGLHLSPEVLHQRSLRRLLHPLRGAQVPLADNQHLSLALFVRAARHSLVLVGQPLPGINEGERNIAAFDCAKRAKHAVVLEILLHPALAPHARGVNEDEEMILPTVARVDRVARGPRRRVHDGPRLSEYGVEKR